MRGVVDPLPNEGVAEVKIVDESDAALDALRRSVGFFVDPIGLSCGGATGYQVRNRRDDSI